MAIGCAEVYLGRGALSSVPAFPLLCTEASVEQFTDCAAHWLYHMVCLPCAENVSASYVLCQLA